MKACHALGEQETVLKTIARAEEWVATYRAEWHEFQQRTARLDETMRPELEGLYRYMMEYTQPDQMLFEAPLAGGPLERIRADLYEQYRRGVGWSAGNLACDCTFSGEKEMAIRLFEENMAYSRGQGWGEPEGNWHLWMAGLKLEVRQDREAALYHLRQAARDSRIVAKGDLKRRFGHMRHDAEFKEIIDTAVLN